ncbi:MAG: protoporphyrinogen oxidase, partial [Acidobacteriota bacterium]
MKSVIVGGGISGLAAAYYLTRQQPGRQVVLLESSPRFGGLIRTQEQDGFCLEAGPDAFVRQKKQAAELCRQLGLESDLIPNRIENQVSYSWSEGEMHPLPRVLNPPIELHEIVHSPLLSESGRQRASREPEIPRGSGQDESVASFMGRRFGTEVVKRVFEPLVTGIFGASASEISLPAAFPRILQYEQQHGRLTSPRVGGASLPAPKATESIFQSLRKGMGQIPAKLVEVLQQRAELHLCSRVRSISRAAGGFEVRLDRGPSIKADSALLATSAPVAAQLLQGSLGPIADLLGRIEYAASILVCLGY